MKYRPICNCPNKRKWVVWGQAILLYCLSSATVFGEETRRVPAATTNSIGMKMVLLPAGEFVMGSPETEEGHAEDERQHQIRITKPFHIGQHEVTVGQFRRFVSDTNYKTAIERDGLPGFGFDTTTKTM